MTVLWKRYSGGALLLGALLLAGCASTPAQQSEPTGEPTVEAAAEPTGSGMPEDQPSQTPAAAGSYIDYATFQGSPQAYTAAGDVVLFFNASWCPTCRAAQESFTSNAVPAGLTLVSVDYDDNTALRQQYGVTVQHTFVQIDPAGQQVAKWTGSTTADEVAGKTV